MSVPLTPQLLKCHAILLGDKTKIVSSTARSQAVFLPQWACALVELLAKHYKPIEMPPASSFPLITELPRLFDASDWSWSRVPHSGGPYGLKSDWWIGTDREGHKWLVKMTGSLFAYQEHVFASLAQRLGLSCQSSAYLLIPSETAKSRFHESIDDPCQLAVCFMDEHESNSCSTVCPLIDILGKPKDYLAIERASRAGIAHFDDLVRGDALGYLCGQFETHEHFFTRCHEYVIIDNERMFETPAHLGKCQWHTCGGARRFIIEVCRGLAEMGDDEFSEIARIPKGYSVSNGRDFTDDLHAAKAKALEYLDLFDEAA